MEDKFVLWDNIYKNEEGNFYTKTWRDNNPWWEDSARNVLKTDVE